MKKKILIFLSFSILILYASGQETTQRKYPKEQQHYSPHHQKSDQQGNPYQNYWNYNTEKRNDTHPPRGTHIPKDVFMSEAKQADPHQSKPMEVQYKGRAGTWSRPGPGPGGQQQQTQGGNWGPRSKFNEQYRNYGNHGNGHNPGYNYGPQYNGHHAYNQYPPSQSYNGGPAGTPMHSGTPSLVDPDLPDGLDDLWELQQQQSAVNHLMKTNPGLAAKLAKSQQDKLAQQYRQQNAQYRGPDKGSMNSGSGRFRVSINPNRGDQKSKFSDDEDSLRNAPLLRNFEEQPVKIERAGKNITQRHFQNQMAVDKEDTLPKLAYRHIQPTSDTRTNLQAQRTQDKVPEQPIYRRPRYRKRGREHRVNGDIHSPITDNKSVRREQLPDLNVQHQPSVNDYEKSYDHRFRAMTHETTSPKYPVQNQPRNERYQGTDTRIRERGSTLDSNHYSDQNQFYKHPRYEKPVMAEFEGYSQQRTHSQMLPPRDHLSSTRQYQRGNERPYQSENLWQNREHLSQQKTQHNQQASWRSTNNDDQEGGNQQTSSLRPRQSPYDQTSQDEQYNRMLLQELVADRLKRRRISGVRNGTLPRDPIREQGSIWDPIREGGSRSSYRQGENAREYEKESESETDGRRHSFSLHIQSEYGGNEQLPNLSEMVSDSVRQRRIGTQRNGTLPSSGRAGARYTGYNRYDPDYEDDRGPYRGSMRQASDDLSSYRTRIQPNSQRLNEYIANEVYQERLGGRSKVNQTELPAITGRKVWIDPGNRKEIEAGRISGRLIDDIIDKFLSRRVDEMETPYGKIEREGNGGYEIDRPLYRMLLQELERRKLGEKPKTVKELEHIRKMAGFNLSQINKNGTARNNGIDQKQQAIWDSLPLQTSNTPWDKTVVSGRQVWTTMNPWDTMSRSPIPRDQTGSLSVQNRNHNASMKMSETISHEAERTRIVFEEPLSVNKTKPETARMVYVPDDNKNTINKTDAVKTEKQAKGAMTSEDAVSEFGIMIAIFAAFGILGAPVGCIAWRLHKQHREKKRKHLKETGTSDDKFEMEAMISHDFGKCGTSESDKGARKKTYFINHVQELKPLNVSGRVSPNVIVHQVNDVY